MPSATPSLLLCLGGLDPTGGAGISIDIQTAAALGTHMLPVTTVQTVQNSRGLTQLHDTDPLLLQHQLNALKEDGLHPQAIKIGALGGLDQMSMLAGLMADWWPDRPVVLDPVLSAGMGGEFGNPRRNRALIDQLGALTTLITPNLPELLQLTDEKTEPDAVNQLFDQGVGAVLVTGGHDSDGPHLLNRLYTADTGKDAPRCSWKILRLPGNYRGTGCQLSTAIACGLARGIPVEDAIESAQQLVTRSLQQAQTLPNGMRMSHPASNLPPISDSAGRSD